MIASIIYKLPDGRTNTSSLLKRSCQNKEKYRLNQIKLYPTTNLQKKGLEEMLKTYGDAIIKIYVAQTLPNYFNT